MFGVLFHEDARSSFLPKRFNFIAGVLLYENFPVSEKKTFLGSLFQEDVKFHVRGPVSRRRLNVMFRALFHEDV